jgi:hypothetical protein
VGCSDGFHVSFLFLQLFSWNFNYFLFSIVTGTIDFRYFLIFLYISNSVSLK